SHEQEPEEQRKQLSRVDCPGGAAWRGGHNTKPTTPSVKILDRVCVHSGEIRLACRRRMSPQEARRSPAAGPRGGENTCRYSIVVLRLSRRIMRFQGTGRGPEATSGSGPNGWVWTT